MTDTVTCKHLTASPSRREEAKAQRIVLRYKTVPALLRNIAYTEGFALSDDLVDAAMRVLSTQTPPDTSVAVLHQMRKALFIAEDSLYSISA